MKTRDARTLRFDYASVPDDLNRLRRWMGTRFAPRPGKPGKVDKPPHRVRRGQPVVKASKSEPENWATFAEACEAYERGDVDAIGLVLTADDPYFGLDEDDVLDHATGEVDATAHHIVHALGTYAEVSCSGTGLRAIGIGSKPEYAGCKSRALGFGVEVYDGTSGAAFLVMTGDHLPGTPEGVEVRQAELEALCRQLWPKAKKKPPRKAKPSGAHSLEDAELLERARRARTGAKFRRLFDRGDATGYPSESEADFALLNMLCFWTAGDAERMAQLFEGSALYRPDEKHRQYVALSARNALASYSGRFYRPRRVDSLERAERDDALAPYLALLLEPSEWTGHRGASAFKAFAAAVIIAAERGIDADGQLRVAATLGRSRRLPVSTHLCGTNQHTSDALETLRLLIRMRGGQSKRARLARLGMVAMFALVALCSGRARGYTVEELGAATGRRKPDLRRVLRRLKSAGIVREVRQDFFCLTDNFRSENERELRESGITYSEERQRQRHEKDRIERQRKLQERRSGQAEDAVKRSDAHLRGAEAMQRTLAGMEPVYRRKRHEQERRKAARPYTDEERVRLLVRQGMAERFARREVYGEPGLDEPPLEDAS